MSDRKGHESLRENRLRQLEAKKIRHQIWEHRVRIVVILLTAVGTLQVSGFP